MTVSTKGKPRLGVMRRVAPLIAAGIMACFAPLAAAAVPNPVVTGPIPARSALGHPSHDYPWMATHLNLAASGYVEEEYFFEGAATRFNTAAGANGAVRDTGHRYRTRMIVRRPASRAKFNGTVLAEWQNVTAGYDLDAMWGGSFEHIMREGYAWVGISAQRVGVHAEPNGLKLWSPTRYGSLDVTAGGAVTDDALSYDIFAQGLQAIRNPQGVNVLGGAVPERVIVIGASQSAGRLATYINSLHPVLGEPVDAYLVFIGGGRIRDNLNVPVFKLLSETDVPGQVAARQPDTARFRAWEVAGTSHSSRRTSLNGAPLLKRDNVTRAPAVCTYPTYPRVPMNYVLGASYDHIVRWVRDGVAPPTAPKLTVTGNVIQRDEHGNALGGIRLAEFAVPTALNSGANAGTSFCRLYGRYEPFPDALIRALYPTHASYTAAVNTQTTANLRAGYIVAADARLTQQRAVQSVVGTGLPCGAACRAAQDLVDSTYFYLGSSRQRDRMGQQASAVVRAVAERDRPGARANAGTASRRSLERYVQSVRSLQSRGEITAAVAGELTAQANLVTAAPPAN